MITFSVNKKPLNEENFKNLAPLMKELKNPDCNEYKRIALSKLIIDYLKDGTKPNIKDYISFGRKEDKRELLNNSRRQIGKEKVYHLRLDTEAGGRIDLPDQNESVEDEVVDKENREVLLKVFGIVEAYLHNMGLSLFEVIDPLIDATEVTRKRKITSKYVELDHKLEGKYIPYKTKALELVERHNDCLINLKPEPDGTGLTDDVIMYLERKKLFDLIKVMMTDKLLWQRVRLSFRQVVLESEEASSLPSSASQ